MSSGTYENTFRSTSSCGGNGRPGLLIVRGEPLARFTCLAATGEMTIGRQKSTLVLPDNRVSRKHARIFVRDGRVFIEDLQSSNGTLVDQEVIETPTELGHGTAVQVGDTRMIWLEDGAIEERERFLHVFERREPAGLMDHGAFTTKLDEVIKGPPIQIALSVLRLNNVIEINSSHGTSVGDDCLKKLADWCRESTGEWASVRLGRLVGPYLAILNYSTEAHENSKQLVRLLESPEALTLQRGGLMIPLDVTLGTVVFSAKDSAVYNSMSLVRRAIEMSEKAARSGSTAQISDLSRASQEETLGSLRIFLPLQVLMQDKVRTSDGYHHIIALTGGNVLEMQRQFGLETTKKWQEELKTAVKERAPDSCVLGEFDYWYILASKERDDDMAEIASNIERRWRMQAGNQSLELIWAGNRWSQLKQHAHPIHHLVHEAISNSISVERAPTLPYPYAGLRHLYRTRSTSKGRVDSRRSALEMSFSLLSACFFGVARKHRPEEAMGVLHKYRHSSISMGAWMSLMRALGKLLGRKSHLSLAVSHLEKTRGLIDLLQRATSTRNDVSHETAREESTYRDEEETIERALVALDELMLEHFEDYQMFAVESSTFDGMLHENRIRILDGDNENFWIQSMRSEKAMVAKWCHLLSKKDGEVFSLAPFFFLDVCHECQKAELCSVRQMPDGNVAYGKGVVTNHELTCDLPASWTWEL